ncbi:S8 family peptidase [Micromonospora okii]|uniref:S8 family peptidase n=1 Tax=Micromonospora okii TaxID=1182970 RepID=UPI001E44DCDE|nr:S8 family peptidase [Micromonospora okii]
MAFGAAAPAAAAGRLVGVDGPDAVADSYLVVFDEDTPRGGRAGVRALTDRLAAEHDVRVEHTYEHALRGFAATMSRATARRIAAEADVSYVEQNRVVRALGTQPSPPSWGLDRIDQRDLPLDGSYTYPTTAAAVRVYVIDTGVRTTHTTFGGRATWGVNTTGDGTDTDCNGHGTHVAGTIGGSQYGVAKGVSLVAVKVLGCGGNGTLAGVTAGVDWVTGHHTAGVPAVANMSLGAAGSDTSLENAVRNSIADGVVYALASGNSNSDACNFTPARVGEALTVNATTSGDARASFSNWGGCTDVFAPGDGIVSASNGSDTATATLSGTSMAAPHVAGAAALVLDGNPGFTPSQVASALLDAATLNKVGNPGSGSPNRLLFTGSGGQQPGTAVLTRYWWSGRDHVSSTTHPGGGYAAEGSLGRVHTGQVSGTHPLYQCLTGSDRFTSLQANCEGRVGLGLIGYVYSSPPGAAHSPIYRCLVRSNGEHFDSNDPNCEGQITEGLNGYTLA